MARITFLVVVYEQASDLVGRLAGHRVQAENASLVKKRVDESGQKVLYVSEGYDSALRSALRRDLWCAMIMNNIGTCFREMGETERARSAFQEFIEFIPEGLNYPDPFIGLTAVTS